MILLGCSIHEVESFLPSVYCCFRGPILIFSGTPETKEHYQGHMNEFDHLKATNVLKELQNIVMKAISTQKCKGPHVIGYSLVPCNL